MRAASANAKIGLTEKVALPVQESAIEPTAERHEEFENILRQALPRFRSIAARWLGNREDAEDAVQDAMLSAFTHMASFGRRAKMSTWLTAIVINAARMQRRRSLPRARVVSLEFSSNEGWSTIADSLIDMRPTPEKTMEQLELYELASKLTCGLAPSQRKALRFYQQNGFSIRNSAGELGIPEGTLKAQLARGRAQLAERFHKVLARPKTPPNCDPKRRISSPCRYESRRVQLCHLPVSAALKQRRREVLMREGGINEIA